MSGTSIGSLIAHIGADVTGLKQGTGQATRELNTFTAAAERSGARVTGAFGGMGRSARELGGELRGTTQQVGIFSSSILNAIAKIGLLEMGARSAFRAADTLVFKFASTMETATLGIASAYMAGGKFVDLANGKVLQGTEALRAAQVDAKRMVEELQVANFQTIATLDQLVRGFQETLPVAMAVGFDRGQVKDFTVGMVQAAGAIDASGQLMHQLGEETRSLLTGTINPRTSRIATVLGIRNEDIKEYEGNAQGLFDFLMRRLAAFRIAGLASQKTWAGLLSNTSDILSQASAKAFEPLFEATKSGLSEVIDSLVTVDDKTKQIVWNPEFLAGTQSIRDTLSSTIGIVSTVAGGLIEHRDVVFGLIKAYAGYKVSVEACGLVIKANIAFQEAWNKVAAFSANVSAIVASKRARAELSVAQGLAAVRIQELHEAKVALAEARYVAMGADMRAVRTKGLLAAETAAVTRAEGLMALATQRVATAQTAALTTTTPLRAAMMALGGPAGILAGIVTLLGAGATAWWIFGNRAQEAGDKAKNSGDDVLANLLEQNRALRERNRLEGHPEKYSDAELRRLKELREQESALFAEYSGFNATMGGSTLGLAQQPRRDPNLVLAELVGVRDNIKEIERLKAENARLAAAASEAGTGYIPNPPATETEKLTATERRKQMQELMDQAEAMRGDQFRKLLTLNLQSLPYKQWEGDIQASVVKLSEMGAYAAHRQQLAFWEGLGASDAQLLENLSTPDQEAFRQMLTLQLQSLHYKQWEGDIQGSVVKWSEMGAYAAHKQQLAFWEKLGVTDEQLAAKAEKENQQRYRELLTLNLQSLPYKQWEGDVQASVVPWSEMTGYAAHKHETTARERQLGMGYQPNLDAELTRINGIVAATQEGSAARVAAERWAAGEIESAWSQHYEARLAQATTFGEAMDATWQLWALSQQNLAQQSATLVMATYNQLTSGIGQSVAQAIVYGESLGKAMEGIMKSVAASIISTLTKMLADFIVKKLVEKTVQAATTAAKMGFYAAETYAAAFAQSVWISGPGAAAYASGMVAEMLSGAAAAQKMASTTFLGLGQADQGMVFPEGGSYLMNVQAGEMISDVETTKDLLGGRGAAGGGEQHIHVHLNGREVLHEIIDMTRSGQGRGRDRLALERS